MKRIVITFAGREMTMSSQIKFMDNAISRNLIDEWHIWNFSRNGSDNEWLKKEFGDYTVILSDRNSIEYIPVIRKQTNEANISVFANSDAHLLVTLDSGVCFEIVIGAYSNSVSIMRRFSNVAAYHLNALPSQKVDLFLEHNKNNIIGISFKKMKLKISLNGLEIFNVIENAKVIDTVYAHTGYGSEGLWNEINGQKNARVKLIECQKSSYVGFRSAYLHYCSNNYADDLFIKMDDDIVYCDIDSLDEFFLNIMKLKGADILSANVINNGVCAYFQKKNGYFPGLNQEFDYPKDGSFGDLWASSKICQELHLYFIKNINAIKRVAKSEKTLQILPQFDRFSINFVGFKHCMLLCMLAAYLSDQPNFDDENLMTQLLPKIFGIRKFIFNNLLVSHLSFYKQDETLNSDELLKAYNLLSIK